MYNMATTVSRVANETYSHTRRIMPEQPRWEHLNMGKYLKEMARFLKKIDFA
jgi:hypothetical protein